MTDAVAAGSAGLAVLLVEDGVVVRGEVRTFLEDVPAVASVATAGSVEQGREELERAAFDIGVIDFRLGDGTALELLERRSGHPLPEVIVVVTQHASPRAREVCREHGADHFVEKRYARESLNRIIDRPPGPEHGAPSEPGR